jgi:hypothetical protein
MPVDVVINPKKSVLKIEFSGLCNEIIRAFAVIQKSLEKTPGTRGDSRLSCSPDKAR